ncbi:MAG: hypothetical protein KFH87_14440 [Bacteroidetes bacterium]|nr:hypothetical protein [Bacteroidota bacterium]
MKNSDNERKEGEVVAGDTRRSFRARIPAYTIRLLALIGLALLIWKIIAVNVLEGRHEREMESLRDSTALLMEERTTILAQMTGEAVASMAALSMRAGNEQYLQERSERLMQRGPVDEYVIADTRGRILATSGKTKTGEFLAENLQRMASALTEPVVDVIEGGLPRVVAPIEDDDGRLGTVILTFRFR